MSLSSAVQTPTPQATIPVAASGSAQRTARSPRRWTALTILALAQFLVVLDASIVNIALPSLGAQLGLDTTALAWVITAYVLPFGGLLLLGGRLADRYGHRNLFLAGTLGFVVASALAGLSVNGEMLLASRALQGASAALLAPASLALVMQLFPAAKDRAKAMGIWGAVAGVGSAAGVLLGGILTAAFGWQAVFYVNIPIGALVLLAIPALISRDPWATASRLDLAGAITITAALVALVGALTSIEQVGLIHPLPLVLILGALALGALFVRIERRAADPLVPLSIFSNRQVTAGNIVMLIVGAAMVALFFALSVYVQSVLQYDALNAGLSQLPIAGAMVLIAAAAPALISRFSVRPVLIASLVILAGGMGWLAATPADAVFAIHVLGPSILIGIGLGAAFVTTTHLSVDGVPGGESGLAGGLINTSQQIGGAIGLAILASLAASRTEALQSTGTAPAEALTAGFSLVFIGAGVLAILAALAAATIRTRATKP